MARGVGEPAVTTELSGQRVTATRAPPAEPPPFLASAPVLLRPGCGSRTGSYHQDVFPYTTGRWPIMDATLTRLLSSLWPISPHD